MKTTEQYFQEFYNEVRYQIEQGSKANFTRANQIWAEYEAAQQNAHLTGGQSGGNNGQEAVPTSR